MKNKNCCVNERLGMVGGQAVLEGVMMKSKDSVALSVRGTDGDISTEIVEYKPLFGGKIAKIPVIRGILNFIDMLRLSMTTLNKSVDMLGVEFEEEPSKLEKWLEKKFGKNLMNIATAVGTVLGVALSLFLFMYIPTVCSQWIFGTEELSGGLRLAKSVFQGVFKIAIFLAYILLVSFIPDIKRTFQYHGAEHKTVFCHEAYEDLTVENVKKHSRYHPRCGTSFMVVMMIVGIFFSFFLVNLPTLIQVVGKIVTLPLVVGVGYEFIKYAGKHDNFVIRALSAPGLWIQRITTKEPDDAQIEVAIRSLKAALPDIYPEALDFIKEESEE